ncbi:MAG TPA: hypothetical protein PLE45_12585 [Spirochaetota bacterium]|nr:hypothetical protein [Spirochaetota bacterium]HOL57106.1 hypothetical protein [Spirochaetota bacterium]HPP04281.1 hypothetical protein [Spirochaetota bacterium]
MIKNIDDLLKRNDFNSIIFKEFIIKTGQISTEIIFTSNLFKSYISYHKEKSFLILLKPLLDYCDVLIKIKDIEKLDFNFVFVIKEEDLTSIKNILEQDKDKYKINIPIDKENIQKYKKEINEQNAALFFKYYQKSSKILEPLELVKQIEEKSKTIIPFSNLKINLDLYNIARIIFPDWTQYLLKIVTFAKDKFIETTQTKKKKYDIIYSIIEGKEIFWDKENSKIPLYTDMISLIFKEAFQIEDSNISKTDIENFFKENNNFIFAKIKSIKKSNVIEENFQNNSYRIIIEDDQSFLIYENNKELTIITQNKTDFLRKKIKQMIIPQINFDFNLKENNYSDDVYIIYKNRFPDIIEKIISSKDLIFIKLIIELFKKEDFKTLKNEYEDIILNLLEYLIEIEVRSIIAKYITTKKSNMSFFSKLLNFFLSPWKVNSIENEMREINLKIENIVKLLDSNTIENSYIQNQNKEYYNPVTYAINIIKKDFNKQKIRETLSKNIDTVTKITEILNMYDDIGATNKAIIIKNEKFQIDFYDNIKKLLK